jgi:hypothetical protein
MTKTKYRIDVYKMADFWGIVDVEAESQEQACELARKEFKLLLSDAYVRREFAELHVSGSRFVALDVYNSLEVDECPDIEGIISAGLETPYHTAALRHAIVNDGVTVQQLEDALGDGRKLQALISPTNPYRFVVFRGR